MLIGLLACGEATDPPTSAGSSADLASLEVGAPLTPAFDPDRAWYAVRASELADPIPVEAVAADAGAVVVTRVEHVDGDDVDGLPALQDHRLVVEVTATDGEERAYVVSLLPDDLPDLAVDRRGEPSPGWYLLADFDFADQPPGIGRYLLALDDAGVPGWWRRSAQPSFDLRATADGRLSWVGAGTTTPDLTGARRRRSP